MFDKEGEWQDDSQILKGSCLSNIQRNIKRDEFDHVRSTCKQDE